MSNNPWMGRFGAQKVSLKALAMGNGKKPGKPSLAGLVKKPLPQKQTKQDFYAGGLLYWAATVTAGVESLPADLKVIQPRGTVNVSNGDQTYTFHNRYGSWMADMGAGRMGEPAYIARLLGTNMGQVEMYQNIRDRFEAELKVKKILTPAQQHSAIEEHQRVQRARTTAAAKRAAGKTTNPWIKKANK